MSIAIHPPPTMPNAGRAAGTTAGQLTLNADRALTDHKDVLTYLGAFEQEVRTLKVEGDDIDGPETIFAIVPSEDNLRAASSEPRVWRFSIGPLEIVVAINLATLGVSVKVVLNIPFLPSVTLAEVAGSLKEGVFIDVGYPGVLGGKIGIKIADGKVVLLYDFSAFGKHFKGEIVVLRL